MAMTKRQTEWYKAIQKVDAQAAERYVTWAGAMRGWMGDEKAPRGMRGKVAGTLGEILKLLDDPDGKYEGRHVFVYGLTDTFASTSKLTYQQADYLLKGTITTDDDGNEQINQANGDVIRAVTIGLVKAGVPSLLGDANAADGARAVDDLKRSIAESETEGNEEESEPSTVDAPKEHKPVTATEEEMDRLKDIAWHRESILSATTRVERDGYNWLFTIRAGIDPSMLQGFLSVMDQATERLTNEGFIPVSDYRYQPTSGGDFTKDDGDGGAQQPYPTDTGETILKSGSAPLEVMLTKPDGQTEYSLKGFQWPMKDNRDAELKLSMIPAPELEMTEADFEPGGAALTVEKMRDRWGVQLVADWIHKQRPDGKKFYDVVRIHTPGG